MIPPIFRRPLNLESILSELIARMLLGRSLRGALKELSESSRSSQPARAKFARCVCHAMEGGIRSIPEADFPEADVDELVRLERTQTRVLPALVAWRERLKTERRFRERAHQVLLQSRMQALLAAGIYFASVVFSAVSGDLHRLGWWLWASALMFLIGVVLIFRLGRTVRWSF